MENVSDETVNNWVTLLKVGDAKAFDRLFGVYSKRLYYFALGYLKSKEEAEEVVQDVFCKIWMNRESLNPQLCFKAYIFKIAYRRINELFRKVAQEQAYRHEIISTSFDIDNNLDERTDYDSLLKLVEKIVNNLPPRQKEIFTKRKRDILSVKEIAELLGIAPKTVENHLNEALKAIKGGLMKENIASLLFFALFVKC
ncbi:MAG: RNA polymerase sigma-70 factor [Mariniphaga sp.]|nr:RNA polymerase sigma-70 factor [Mariniphaga sp.]